jgi:hypothetical protein
LSTRRTSRVATQIGEAQGGLRRRETLLEDRDVDDHVVSGVAVER